MILQALVKYYEALLEDGKAVPEGWCMAKVAYALNLSKEGDLRGVIPLKQSHERGKKTVWLPEPRKVPKMTARSSGVSANFLCDNSKYMLGADKRWSRSAQSLILLLSKSWNISCRAVYETRTYGSMGGAR